MANSSFFILDETNTQISGRQWMPEKRAPKGVLLICHGMMEHSLHYEELGIYLAKKEYAVYCHDQRAHGKTAKIDQLGIVERQNWKNFIIDIKELYERVKKNHPNTPIFLLGHSMGSYVAQDFCQRFSPQLAGLLLSGTSFEFPLVTRVGKLIIESMLLFQSGVSPATTVHRILFGTYNRQFKPHDTENDWLSRDADYNRLYSEDKMCGFVCSLNFFYDLFGNLSRIYRRSNLKKLSTQLPLYFFSGSKDPLSLGGRTVKMLKKKYQRLGSKDISIKIYDNARHVTLHETNKDKVFADLLDWLVLHT
jgi:alpha-beta hydrolase superfamily lysophospholipase